MKRSKGMFHSGEQLDDTFVSPRQDESGVVSDEALLDELLLYESMVNKSYGTLAQLRQEYEGICATIVQLEEEKEKACDQEKEAALCCYNLGEALDGKYQEVLQQMQEIATTLSLFKTANPMAQLISQIPLEMYRELCHDFFVQVRLYLKQQFEESARGNEHSSNHVCSSNNSSLFLIRGHSQIALEKMFNTLNKMEECIYRETFWGVLEMSEEAGLDVALQNAVKFKIEFEKIQNKLTLHFLRSQLTGSSEEVLHTDIAQVELASKDFANYKVLDLVVSPECEMKLCRQKYKIKKLNCVFETIQTWLSHSDILYMMMVDEKQQIMDMMDILTSYQLNLNEEYECFIVRMVGMQRAKDKFVMYLNGSTGLHSRLEECLGALEIVEKSNQSNSSLKEAVIALNEDLDKKEEQLFVLNLSHQKQIVQINEENIKQLKRLISSESTIQLVNLSLNTHNEVKLLMNEFEQCLELIISKRNDEQVHFEMKPFVRKLRMLWIYFLTNPSKLCSAVQDVKNDFQSQLNSSSLLSTSPLWNCAFSTPR